MGTEMSGSNVTSTSVTLRTFFKAEQRHYRARERFLRKQAANPHHVTHVPNDRRGLLVREPLGTRNATVAACRAFVPRKPKRGGQQAPRRLDYTQRATHYQRQQGYDANHLTARQHRQLERMGTLDARDEMLLGLRKMARLSRSWLKPVGSP
jgi:hypothetical protein